ncbi:hypothetical protein CIB95_01520 [Lottiidibacillus patelloidae]|uniref:CYTH domain-containing protein n=1 Tax=Lottiidibacillus patelloidae TaxID=2670334 RepID=A0A263BY92_9BACI|nr:CYTH domain-containing protein [Lottiidibacillus patelloidae]OZM58277.1 hypothetical protein CIB95_01520 [Lottiidibacillus patelloidae]
MSQQLEIEFKNMLTNQEYLQLLQEFSIDTNDIYTQINYYLDTQDFSLMQAKSALRVREKNGYYTLTLKQPVKAGVLETNQRISIEEFDVIKKIGRIPNGAVNEVIKQIGIATDSLTLLGNLKTNRVSFPYKEGKLFLDHSMYLNKEDFELEYEVEDREIGNSLFLALLNSYHIPVRNTDNKIIRFFTEKKKQQSSI